MIQEKTIDDIKSDLEGISGLDVVVFGSYVEGGIRETSDIDIAVITRNKDVAHNTRVLMECLVHSIAPYDIHVFELLPIHVRMSIVKHFLVLFGNRIDISEYFYQTRKEWNDCRHRIASNQFTDYKEKRALMKRARDLLVSRGGIN